MKNKKTLLIPLFLILLVISLLAVNRDLFRFTYDLRLERNFDPEIDRHQDYLLTEAIPLKPGSYVLSPILTAEGSGSAVILIDGSDREVLCEDLSAGTEDPSFPFTITGSARQVRFGIRYDPSAAAIRLNRLRITSDHVLYRDSVLRHLTLSALLLLITLWLIFRICFPDILRKLFPLFSKPKNEAAAAILIILTLLASYPLLNSKTYIHGEDMFFHLTRIKGLADSLRAGYFPVRDQLYWLHNYGYGVGFFYPDVFLYFPAVMVLLGFNLLTAYKVFLVTCTFFSILSTWYAALRISGNRTAAYAASIFIAFAAYRLSNIYYRGTVGETQAAIFFPLIILGLYEIFYGSKERWPIFAFGFLGLLCCHIISLTMAFVLTAIYMLTQLRKILTDREIIPALLKSAALVLGLGAFFWLPMLEQSITNSGLRVNSVLAGEVQFNSTNYAFPVQNLLSRFKAWNYAFQADCIYPGWSLLIIPLLALFPGKKRDKTVKAADFFLVFALILLWMCTRAFPWTLQIFQPFVIRIQFAYRLLLPATILLCISGGIYCAAISKGRKTTILLAVLTVFCFLSTAYPVLQESVTHRTVNKNMFIMQDNRVSGAEYLPVELDRDFPGKNADTVLISESDTAVTITAHDRQKLSFTFSYELSGNDNEVNFSIPLIYYTGFQAAITAEDGTVLHPAVSRDERGLVSLSSGGISRGTVFVSYEKTAIQHIGEIITLISAAVCVPIFARRKRKPDKNITAKV